ncbi:MAG TPA: RdgB/HAM1 family non-canonical purine NTP pyrophosphatase [Kofleriaceae bacterium]|nr:RdgB/HAM1 family non-canonical purine NTP pyrophosphatase [Kofleriaceae bacterium]
MSGRALVFATRNRGKLVELRQLLPNNRVLSIDEAQAQLGMVIPEVDEDADTFVGNAAKKAREVSRATGLPALADDSGLCVDALDGAPGVYSARYAGPDADDAANNAKLLAALANVPAALRTARFRCSLVLADVRGPLADAIITADGVCEGEILTEARGTGGFGYDPLFYFAPLGQTFAELGVGSKSDLSHRARAMRAIAPELQTYLAKTQA